MPVRSGRRAAKARSPAGRIRRRSMSSATRATLMALHVLVGRRGVKRMT
jgi:hypothetical protein